MIIVIIILFNIYIYICVCIFDNFFPLITQLSSFDTICTKREIYYSPEQQQQQVVSEKNDTIGVKKKQHILSYHLTIRNTENGRVKI